MPEDMDIYMKKIKQRADGTDSVMDKLKTDKMAELDKLRLDTEMEEVRARLEENRAKIRESQQTGQAPAPQQAYNLAELLFAGRPPEEVKQIINSLTQEEIQKLAYMASAMNNSKLSEFTAFMRQPSTTMKEVVEAVKLGTEIAKPQQQQQGSVADMAKSIVEAIKLGVDMGKAQAPQAPQQSHTEKYLDLLLDELKMARQEQSKEREARLEKEITELKNRPGIMDELAGSAEKVERFRKMFGNSGGKSEADITVEKMQQEERLENRKLDWEMKKFDKEAESGDKTIGLIKDVMEGPVGRVIESLGKAGADRVRGKPLANGVAITCPNCHKQFNADPNAAQVECPSCGATLEKQAPQQTPPPPPSPQPQESAQSPQQTEEQQPVQAEQPPT